ncbi:adhesion G protein-coupled receptor B1-like isoform X2 [Ptychodera flava]|uniref:adhesion G protein-coupled receptor B1-like isoform X2 n=1 Tax=Ptychodera flava TaxID=63121 RepID=UPI00396A1980
MKCLVRFLTLTLFLRVYSLVLDANAPLCPAGWVLSETHDVCFFFSEEAKTAKNSRDHCVSLSAQLVKLDNLSKQERLKATLHDQQMSGTWYIGLHCKTSLLNWKWVDDTPASFTFWAETQSQEPITTEHICTVLNTIDYHWYEVRCSGMKKFICEKPPNALAVENYTTKKTEGEASPTRTVTTKASDLTTADLHTSVNRYSTQETSAITTPSASSSQAVFHLPQELGTLASFPLSAVHSNGYCDVNIADNEKYRVLGQTKTDVDIRLNVPGGSFVSTVCGDGFRGDQHNVVCNGGTLIPPLPTCEDINECQIPGSENVCPQNERCVNTVGSFQCICASGFVKQSTSGLCVPHLPPNTPSIKLTSTDIACNSEGYGESDIQWRRTPAGEYSDWISCPIGSNGVMRRYCDEYGNWVAPDTTFCKSHSMSEIEKLLIENVTWNDLTKTTEILESLDDSLNTESTVYDGDLITTRDILGTISANKQSYEDDNETDDDLLPFIRQFLATSSRGLDSRYTQNWNHAYENLGPEGSAVSLLSALENFSDTVYAYMLQTGKELFLETVNVDLIGFFTNNGPNNDGRRRKRSLNRNDTMRTFDTITLSDRFSKQFPGNETDLPVALVVFVYRDAGEMLPADFRQTNVQRTWVKSITATKVINKVNTVAIVVSVHPNLEDVFDMKDLAVLRLYEMREAFNPRCSIADTATKIGIWDSTKCRFLGDGMDVHGEYVECSCDKLGTIGVIMTLGTEPQPFLAAAAKVIRSICSGISALLILVALVMILFARLSSDRYFVLGQTLLSLTSFPVIICVESVINFEGKEKDACQILAVAKTYWLLSNCFWIMNLSVQQLLRFLFIDRRTLARVLYALIGWILPLIIVIGLYGDQLPDAELIVSCLLVKSTPDIATGFSIALLSMVGTMGLICYGYYLFTISVQKFGSEEGAKLWKDMFSLMLLFGVFCTVRITGYLTTVIDSLYGGYFFTMAIFFEGSVIFLSFFANNHEVVVAIRIRIYGDEDESSALTEVQAQESAIFAERKEIVKLTKRHAKEVKKRRKMQDLYKAEKSRKIHSLFEAAQRSHRIQRV